MNLILKDFFFMPPQASREGGPSSSSEIRQRAKNVRGLRVEITASHAGMVNANNIMYSPGGMESSCYTWTYPQPRPFQVHHDDHADPIGRITSGKFAPYQPGGQADSLNTVIGLFQDAATRQDLLDAAQMLEDTGVLATETWRGVGEMKLEAIITDSDAIEKILDGRYLGVSITQRPRQAFCNICGKDWVSEGPCQHERGMKDEETGRMMYLIVGDTHYEECSAVNRPADGHAKIENAQFMDSVQPSERDAFTSAVGLVDPRHQTAFSIKFLDSLEGDNMNKPEPETPAVPATPPEEPQADAETPPPTPEPDLVEEALRTLFEDEGSFTEEMAERLNEELEKEIEEEDAKLSTEKRKSLAPSTFCGPNKSFPVPDCAHVTAARRLVGRYKGPGSKESILACVSRKAKALGCGGGKDELPPEEEQKDNMLCLDCLPDQELQQRYLDCEKLMVARKLKIPRECEDCAEKQAKIDELNVKIPEMEDTVKVLRQEWREVTAEHSLSERSHAETTQQLLDVTRDYARLVLSLTKREQTLDDIRAGIDGADIAGLRNLISDSKTDECIEFIRSGLARQPEGTVTPQEADALTVIVDESAYLPLAQRLVDWSREYGEAYAQKHLFTMIAKEELPAGFTLAKARDLVAK